MKDRPTPYATEPCTAFPNAGNPLDCLTIDACRWESPLGDGTIQMARWAENQRCDRKLALGAAEDRIIVLIAIRPVEIELSSSGNASLNGAIPSGSCYVAGPDCSSTLTVRSSFDFLCLRIATRFAAQYGIVVDESRSRWFRDPVIETLVRALVDNGKQCEAFTLGLTQALAARSLDRRAVEDRGTPLPKWRLAKLERYIASRLHEAVSLEEMAEAVDLSRMHFAKSFRLATGFTPHEYLLFRRIEWAKNAMLTSRMNLCEIALEAGFQAQAHFSTVFKRFTGTSPAQWKLENLRPA